MSLVLEVVEEVADREGVGPLDLDTPLEEAVDTDRLAAVAEESDRGNAESHPAVEFEYYGYTVIVDGSGNVTVEAGSDGSDGRSAAGREQSLAELSTESTRRPGALQTVTDVIAARERPFEERLHGLLAVVRKALEVDVATLSYVDSGTYTFEAVDAADTVDLQAGEVVPTSDTTCKRVVETEQALVTGDLAADAPELTDSAFDVGSYLGVPVFVDGDVYGTFCFFDSEPRDEAFTDWDRSLVELLSRWVSSKLEQRHRDRALHAATTERPYRRC